MEDTESEREIVIERERRGERVVRMAWRERARVCEIEGVRDKERERSFVMRGFKSADSYYKFSRDVCRSNRYFRGSETDEFFAILLQQAQLRRNLIPKGTGGFTM